MPSSLDVTFVATIRRVLTIAVLLIFTRDPLTRARLSEVSYLILGFYGTCSVVLSMAMRLGRPFLILSAHRQPQSRCRVHKPLLKHGEQEVKASKQPCRTASACEADAQQELLASHKGHVHAECGFRFRKGPRFLAAWLYLKTPERILALQIAMMACLPVAAALMYRLRKALKGSGGTFERFYR
jgi:hypothetical protein